jgi:hypothetical protein
LFLSSNLIAFSSYELKNVGGTESSIQSITVSPLILV